jgi:serine/threonine protein kinase
MNTAPDRLQRIGAEETSDSDLTVTVPGHKSPQAIRFPADALQTNGYRDLLLSYNLNPIAVDFHWQVGRITRTQGWLLHISIVRSQIVEAMQVIIPVLLSNGVPFRIVKDHETAISVLDGNLGREYLGKILTIYPVSDEQALELAKNLITRTVAYKGPDVLTDIWLGGVVYTRYGGFDAVTRSDAGGNIKKFIYDQQQNLVVDAQPIPFVLPAGVSWPFSSLVFPQVPVEKKILHGIYRPLAILKSDPRGNVIKSFYLTKFLFVKTCVIKQAKRNMWSDDHGRDMADRLRWQQKLYEALGGIIRMPQILDLFEENGDTYMAMRFVRGQSVFDHISSKVNPNCDRFEDWPVKKKIEAVNYLIEIARIVQALHDAGFVHRDVTPVNFLIDKRKRLMLIDNELAKSLNWSEPNPPFEFGTHGFMSPEQLAIKAPTIKEDIYGLGATLISVLTSIPPTAFDVYQAETLQQHLAHFIVAQEIVVIVTACLSLDPSLRPTAKQVGAALNAYRQRLVDKKQGTEAKATIQDQRGLREVIEGAIKGLVTAPMMIHKGLWQTRLKNSDASSQKPNQSFAKSGGLYEGIAGVMYSLAEASLAGFDVTDCVPMYQRNYDFLRERYLQELPHLPPGMSGGAAGMAMALTRGMVAGLIEPTAETRRVVQSCLEIPPAGLDLANGAAGQGMAAIKCSLHLDVGFLSDLLTQYVTVLLEAQDKQGNWLMLRPGRRKPETAILFNQGNTGINLFLLECYTIYKAIDSENIYQTLWIAILKSLKAFKRIHGSIKKRFQKIGFRGSLLDAQLRDGFKGLILNYLKAYEITADAFYLDQAEDLLTCYPHHLVHEDFTFQYGLASIGCLYLEAFRVSNKKIWQERANWIRLVFENTAYTGNAGNLYWLTNNQTLPAADYMVGNAGILHFLIEFHSSNRIKYVL